MTAVQPKFKVGDVLEVFCRSSYTDDKGSVPRKNFIVGKIENIGSPERTCYFSTDRKQGAFECQLRRAEIEDWRSEFDD